MKKLNKTKWAKPKLVILTRGKPEERVLAACKGDHGEGPVHEWGPCVAFPAPGVPCMAWVSAS